MRAPVSPSPHAMLRGLLMGSTMLDAGPNVGAKCDPGSVTPHTHRTYRNRVTHGRQRIVSVCLGRSAAYALTRVFAAKARVSAGGGGGI
jgi:hypothetical protein